MKCFIHTTQDAIAACRQCGKGMCEECSSYSGHSGICPECRLQELIKEKNSLDYCYRDENAAKKWSIFWLILTFWTIIGLFWNLIRFFQHKNKCEELDARIDVLNKEIRRLQEAKKSKKGAEFH